MIDQDFSLVTGGYLRIIVDETNQESNLVVKVNGEEVFNQKVTEGLIEIPIKKDYLEGYNSVKISASRSGWKFWVKPFYKLDVVEFYINFYGNLEKVEEFQVYPDELGGNFKTGEVYFKLKDYSGGGDLIISVNNYRIYKGTPGSLEFHQSFDQSDVGLVHGLNTISFAAESGANYEIGDCILTIIRGESGRKSRSFDFVVSASDYNDNLEGTISFYISDTDYTGNLLVTITDTAGNKHPTETIQETIQSYSIGKTIKVDFNKDYVNIGTNTMTFEATAGNFVLSNVEVKAR